MRTLGLLVTNRYSSKDLEKYLADKSFLLVFE